MLVHMKNEVQAYHVNSFAWDMTWRKQFDQHWALTDWLLGACMGMNVPLREQLKKLLQII